MERSKSPSVESALSISLSISLSLSLSLFLFISLLLSLSLSLSLSRLFVACLWPNPACLVWTATPLFAAMIYLQGSPKYQNYLRRLTLKEKMASIYQKEIEKAEALKKKEMQKEEKRWYSNWEDALPALYMDTQDLREKLHAAKYRQEHGLPA